MAVLAERTSALLYAAGLACLVAKDKCDLQRDHIDCPQHGPTAPRDERVGPKPRLKGSALRVPDA